MKLLLLIDDKKNSNIKMNALRVHENVFRSVLSTGPLLESRETDSTDRGHQPGGMGHSILALAYSSHLHGSSLVAWRPCARL